MLSDNPAHFVEISNVCLDEGIIRLVFNILEICKIAGVSELVKVDNIVFGIFVDKQAHNM